MSKSFSEYQSPKEREEVGYQDGYNNARESLRETYAHGSPHPEDAAYTKGYNQGLDDWWQLDAEFESKLEREYLDELSNLREGSREIEETKQQDSLER